MNLENKSGFGFDVILLNLNGIKRLGEVKLPAGIVIAGVDRGETGIVPDGDAEIKPGDCLTMLSGEHSFQTVNGKMREFCQNKIEGRRAPRPRLEKSARPEAPPLDETRGKPYDSNVRVALRMISGRSFHRSGRRAPG